MLAQSDWADQICNSSAVFAGAPDARAAVWAVVVGGGVAAAFVDTVLGATVQARYRAPGGALTERATDGGRPLPRAAGWRWVDNDRVNGACTAVGGAIPLLVL